MVFEQKYVSGNDYTIQSVQTALRILNLFIPDSAPLSLAEISRRLSLNKSMVLRMTATLTNLGYLKIHPETRKYMLGTTALQLGLSAYVALDLHRVSEPVLSRLADATGCVVHLGCNENNTVVVIERVFPHRQTIRINGPQIGGFMPTHCTGIGLLFLSQEDDLYIRNYLERGDQLLQAPATGHDIEAIMNRIQDIRTDGYCVNDCEYEPGIVSIAYPIHSHVGRIIAGLSISGAREIMNGMAMSGLHAAVRTAAGEISSQLGWSDAQPLPDGQPVPADGESALADNQ